MKEKLARFMMGRYGNDPLNKVFTIAALVLMLASVLWQPLNSIAMALLVLSIFRMFSRNTDKRQAEMLAFDRIKNKVVSFFKRIKNQLFGTKTHRYFKCPGCKLLVRVPRGKGKIVIHCPKCKADFEKRT